jgi:tetratricopeptide (TPR) repeat protein
MNNDKSKAPNAKPPAAKTPAAKPVPVKPVPVKVAPLFRKIDWLVLAVVFGVVWIAYLLTLAPELTLEDSGELCTASYYAGIPHPPGYPFWAIYSWLWTVIVPFGNVTWRVEVGESFAAAMACGLVGFMVSRGASMLIEGIDELKDMSRKWENIICIVTGIVAGLLLGFDRFMWMESVVINRISLFDVPWIMVVALCLFRWIYAPQQKRYLYIGMFFFGVCATIHQTMLVAAMGIEVCIAIALPRLGRDLFLGNSIIFGLGLLGMWTNKVEALNNLAPMFKGIFYVVGLGSIAAGVWLTLKTKKIGTEWKAVLFMGLLWMAGAAFYFYEPISGMSDPPMQWGYPRTVQGFFHALSRGQYEKSNPTDIIHDPTRFITQLGLLISGLADSFGWVYLFIAMLPFLFLWRMKNRERAWIIGLAAIYLCIGVLLTIIMNTTPDRETALLCEVFFTASHAVVAILIGYGFALMAAYMATHYGSFRIVGLTLGTLILLPAFVMLFNGVGNTFYGSVGSLTYQKALFLLLSMVATFVLTAMAVQGFMKKSKSSPDDDFLVWLFGGGALLCLVFSFYLAFSGEDRLNLKQVCEALPRIFAPNQYSLPVWGALLILGTVVVFIASLLVYRNRAPMLITLCIFAAAPVYSGLSHWYKSEQRNHWFGYWFGHDMFTPPFTDPKTGQLSYDNTLRAELLKNPENAKTIYPEMDRNTILFGGTDPGRFCPTYEIFCDSFIPHNCQPLQDQKFDRRDVYLITQNALADGTYLDYLRAQYFRSQQSDPPFFSRFFRFIAVTIGLGSSANVTMDLNSEDAGKGNTGNSLVEGMAGLLDTTLDKPFTALGAKIEARRRAEGVYPKNEIYIPSAEDSQICFSEYYNDVGERAKNNQLQPGEDVNVDQQGHVSVSGQVAVMNINGLLCKVIFDHNPTNAFYVEESFPLNWMYPYETPFGIIMKINRNPLPTLTDDIFKKDHEFWSKYSERLIGNWITYDTSVSNICAFAEKIYIGNNYEGYTGDRKFIRDDDAQKAFSKLRSSQAGVYAWRLSPQCPPEYRPKNQAELTALQRETDFAFKQSFAFCPYSPEAVYRYVNFLLQSNPPRFDDALLVAQTCQKLDPYNGQITGLIKNLQDYKSQFANRAQTEAQLQQMETEVRQNPTNIQNILNLAGFYLQMQQTNRVVELFDRALAAKTVSASAVGAIAQMDAAMRNYAQLETALEKMTVLSPDQPEPWYDLAALKAILGKPGESLQALRVCLDLNAKRRKTNPAATDLLATCRTDARFDSLRTMPEFQKIVPP